MDPQGDQDDEAEHRAGGQQRHGGQDIYLDHDVSFLPAAATAAAVAVAVAAPGLCR
jgi:hypothetical protein